MRSGAWRTPSLAIVLAIMASLPAAAQVGPIHPERRETIEAAYRQSLGRAPSAYELYWWTLYPDQPVGVVSATNLRAALLQALRNSTKERLATTQRVRAATGTTLPQDQLEALVAAKGFDGALRAAAH